MSSTSRAAASELAAEPVRRIAPHAPAVAQTVVNRSPFMAGASRITTLAPPPGQFILNFAVQIAGFAAAIAFGVFAVRSVRVAISSENVALQANSLSTEALRQSQLSNQLALIALCSASNGNISSMCFQILENIPVLLPSVASKLGFTATPTTTTSSSSTVRPDITSSGSSTTLASSANPSATSAGTAAPSPSGAASSGSVPVGPIVGGVLGGVFAVILIVLILICISRRRRRGSVEASETQSAKPPTSPWTPSDTVEEPASRYNRPVTESVKMSREKKRSWGASRWFRQQFVESTIRASEE